MEVVAGKASGVVVLVVHFVEMLVKKRSVKQPVDPVEHGVFDEHKRYDLQKILRPEGIDRKTWLPASSDLQPSADRPGRFWPFKP